MTTAKDTSKKLPPEHPIQTEILGEYYFRKDKLGTALEIFLQLNKQDPYRYKYCYYLGKIYYRLGNVAKATDFLQKAKNINPLHRQTLLLLHHCYSRKKEYHKAFECILDLYILAKEVKDQHIEYYEKRIRSTARKIEDFTIQKKSEFFKSRMESLQSFFDSLEKTMSTFNAASFHHTEELSPDLGKNLKKLPSEETLQRDDEGTDPLSMIDAHDQQEISDEVQAEGDDEDQSEDAPMVDSNKTPAHQEPSPAALKLPEVSAVQLDTQAPVPDKHMDTMSTADAEQASQRGSEVASSPKESVKTDLNQHLSQVPFLRQLAPEKLTKIQHFTSILSFEDGETIFAENDPVFGFHILLKGDVEMRKGSENIHYYSSPKIVDEDDFFRVNYRSFSLFSRGPSSVLFFNKAGYQNLFQRDATIAISLLWHFTQSLSQKIDGCIEEILLQTPNDRFMEELDQKHEVSNLRKLNDKELKVLSSLFDPIILKKKEKLYSIQEDRQNFFIVLDGRIECSNPKRHPISIQKNEYFGEMVFCGPGYPHLYDAQVVSEEASILQISHKQLATLTQFEQADQKFLADMFVRILSNKNKELRELLYQTRYLKNKG